MTASPQIRDTLVSGGQGTDNAEVGGSIPPSPTNPWWKATFLPNWAQQSRAEIGGPVPPSHTRGEGIPAGQLPFQCQLTVTFDNRGRPLPPPGVARLWHAGHLWCSDVDGLGMGHAVVTTLNRSTERSPSQRDKGGGGAPR